MGHPYIWLLKIHMLSASYNILLPFQYTAEMYHAIFHLLYINDTPFVLLKRLPDESSKKSLIQTVEAVIDEYRDDIDLNLIGFPEKYLEIMENNL